jgi:hypothetical protein
VVNSLKRSVSWGPVSYCSIRDDLKQTSPCRQLWMGGKSQFYESIALGMWTYLAVVLALV